MTCMFNLKATAFVGGTGGVGSIAAGAIASLCTGTIQPLIVGAAIAVLATAVGVVASAVLTYIKYNRGEIDQLITGGYIYLVSNMVLHITATAMGGMLTAQIGKAMLFTSFVIHLFLLTIFDTIMIDCLQISRSYF